MIKMETRVMQKSVPEGWQSKTLGDFLIKLEGGGTPSKENPSYWEGSIPWASVKDIVTHNPNDTQDHISELGLQNSSSRLVSRGTLIVPTRMALGHAVVFDVDVAINQDLKALYPKENLSNHYLFHWFKSKKQFIERLGSGSTVTGIQQEELKRIKFNLPPLLEQKRIVSVLEISEKLIKMVSEKIEMKKNIKQGLMQELLSGKTRVEGFSGEWHAKELSTLCNISTGKKDVNEGNPNGVYPFFTCAREHTYSDDYSFDTEAILIAGNADVGHCKYYSGKFEAYQRTYVLSRFQNSDAKYLFLFLSHYFKNHVESLKQIGAMSYIKLPMLKEFLVRVPSLEEQKAIANVLTTADEELEQLESKLRILKNQEKYLLNNLITGAIRTPEKV